MRIHASSIGRRASRGLGWLAALSLMHVLAGGGSPTAAQTWKVSTSIAVHDDSAELCGFTDCWSIPLDDTQTRMFTLPGGTPVPLFVSTNYRNNFPDNGIRDCAFFGPPGSPFCQDSSYSVGSSGMGHKKWTAHHDLWAKAFQRNHGTATAASHAEGVLKVVWPGHSGAVPDGTLQAHFHATGHLHASCGAPFGLSASADMQIHVTLTPFERAPGVGGLPPAVPNLDMTWTAICNVVDDIGDVFDVVAPMPGGLVVGDRYMFTIDWTNKTVAESVITDTPVADASAMFPSTGDFFSDSTGDPGIAIDFDVPDPPLLACPLNVVYFRGACATGTVGAPCNVDADCGAGSCAVTAAIGDDQTVLKWPTGSGADVYRGLIPTSGAAVWTISGGNLTLNNAACLGANVVGDTSGPLSQVDDPNPAAGTSLYYQVSFNDPAGTSINAQGCALPAVCNNAGWCELGTTPGMPCNVSLDCAGGGICLIRPTPCAIASGGGDVGGCALHATCAGGANAGRLCFAGPDCPGSSCTAVPAGTVTPGQICYSIGGAGCEACPTAGNPARLGRLVPIASMCP